MVPAPPSIRVLVVDDSAYMRHVLSRHLNATPDLRVVGQARDGQEALELIPTLNPDVVTLDVEMPRLDGLATLRAIMARYPRPVVMFSHLTATGTVATVRALIAGAVDFVAKPKERAQVNGVMGETIAKVRAAAQARVHSPARLKPKPPEKTKIHTQRSVRLRDKVVVIGASTGGPHALQTVLHELPADLPAALLIVQHLPIGFTHALAERLNTISPLAIQEAAVGNALQLGVGLLAPSGFHMTLDRDGLIALNTDPTRHGVRPAVDLTMAAAAQHYGKQVVGVVLTGMGRDGTEGALAIRAAGGQVIAEAEASCVVWGMPRSVVEAGAADVVVPLPEVAKTIERLVRG